MDLQCVTFRRSEMKGSYFHQCDTQKDHSVTVIDDRGEGDDVLEKDGMAPDDRTLQYRHFP